MHHMKTQIAAPIRSRCAKIPLLIGIVKVRSLTAAPPELISRQSLGGLFRFGLLFVDQTDYAFLNVGEPLTLKL
jgi:hypothetical protein